MKMRIIDAHHHYWDTETNYHPWLRDEPMIPFRYGDYSPIKKPFLPEHYSRVAKNWDIIATVTMEGEWDPADVTGEALWMKSLANESGNPASHVAQAWLDKDDIDDVLELYETISIVKSVRHKPRSNDAPGGPKGQMTEANFRRGFQKLADANLHFDLQSPWWHLHEAVDLASSSPETSIILNHCGLPSDRSASGLAKWRAALANFAELPNSYVKISGIGIPGKPWLIADNIEIIRYCIDTFGPARAMFASNFPVDGLCGSFDTIYQGYNESVSGESEDFREALFFRTAASVYGIDVRD